MVESTSFELEKESLQPRERSNASSKRSMNQCEQLAVLVRLYLEYYPKLTAGIGIILALMLAVWIIPNLRSPVTRNRLSQSYAEISLEYDFKAAQIKHWCLWGGNDDCTCLDFTEPEGRFESDEWIRNHLSNKNMVAAAADLDIDVLFIGDGMVERLNGTVNGAPTDDAAMIKRIFAKSFSKDSGGDIDGLAVGIEGDQAAHVMWRLENGELPNIMNVKVYWIWLGIEDLVTAYCSEEATVLGILKTAEMLAVRDPDAVVVIQGLLPYSRHGGNLQDPMKGKIFHHNAPVAHSVNQARKMFYFWPSIQNINKQLEAFCEKNDQIVYYDASELFIGSIVNAHYRTEVKTIMPELMPDFQHLSPQGYRLLLSKIKDKVQDIIFEINEENVIEHKSDKSSD